MSIDRRVLAGAVRDQVATITNVTVCVGEPTEALPTVNGSDGRVQPYVILWPGAGTPSLEQDVADTAVDLDWLIQVTCAAGYVDDVLALVTRVDAALYRWVPTMEGVVCGPLKPPLGYDPGPVLLDRDVTPHRPYLPLQYRTTITAT